MKQMKKYLFRLVAFLGLTITPFIASAEEVSLGESISKFLNDTGFARLVEGNWLCLVMIAVACLLFYLAIVKKFEPLLLLPIAFGMLLTNLPGAGCIIRNYLKEDTFIGRILQMPITSDCWITSTSE